MRPDGAHPTWAIMIPLYLVAVRARFVHFHTREMEREMVDRDELSNAHKDLHGLWRSSIIYTMVDIGLADALSKEPQSIATLATATETNASALYRLLRCAAAMGYVNELESDSREPSKRIFTITPRGATLRSDSPDSLRALVLLHHAEWQTIAWRNLKLGIRSGAPVLPQVIGETAYSYLEARPNELEVFATAMASPVLSGATDRAIAAKCDFHNLTTVIDIGGGVGAFLTQILHYNPELSGILIELPQVVDAAVAYVAGQGLAERCTVIAADFFGKLPPIDNGSVVVLKRVLHNWGDQEASQILRNVRSVVPSGTRLLIAEPVLPEYGCAEYPALLDLCMLLYCGGLERTLREHQQLLEASGFAFERHDSVSETIGLVEAVAASPVVTVESA
jgi:hypothetical protein